ncbi:MAG: AhpC/TSA family protein [Bacteroidales bacterium]|nr:AhpC/TSA family protein [Bacteroidales bacterium]
MKRLLLLSVLIAAAASCTSPQAPISGRIDGIQSDTLYIAYSADEGIGIAILDTLALSGGKFSYTPPSDESGVLMIFDKDDFCNFMNLYYVPGEKAVIEGSMVDYTVSGTPFYADCGEFLKQIAPLEARRHDLMSRLGEEESDDLSFDFHGEEKKLSLERDAEALKFIEGHPDSDYSAYLATDISIKRFEEAYALLSDKAREGRMARLLNDRRMVIKGEAERYEAMGKIVEGAEAPDFTLKTSNGGTFTLSEQRGKYVLLDFWGTWCHWCCEGIPNVKEISRRYSDKLTVVSIDTGDTEKGWMDGIEKYGMDWIQVYNSKADAIDGKYAVEGFPGFYLIDPEGIIKMISFGEPYDFVEAIGKLLE